MNEAWCVGVGAAILLTVGGAVASDASHCLRTGTDAATRVDDPAAAAKGSTSWQAAPDAPFAWTRFDAEFDPWSGYVVFLGGRLGDNSTDGSIWAYNPGNGAYLDTGVDMPNPVSNYTTNLLETSTATGLFTVGGRLGDGTLTRTVQYYNPKLNLAGELAAADDFPGAVPPGAALTAVVANRIYVAGGYQSSDVPHNSEETWVLDLAQPEGSRWTRLVTAALVPGRAYTMSGVVDGRIYAIGGATGDSSSLYPVTNVQVLDPQAEYPVWASLSPLPEPCSDGRAWGFDSTFQGRGPMGRLAGQIVVTCGGWPTENDRVYLYDTHSDQWLEFPPLLDIRRDHAAALVPLPTGPVMAVWGGRSGSDSTLVATPEYFALDESPCPVLLVDDDLRSGGVYAGGGPYYQRALLQLGWDYTLWDVATQGAPLAADLAPYPTVLWFTGNDRSTCVTAAEEGALVDYLEAGGNLVLSSPDQVRAGGLTPLLTDYLWVQSATEDVSAVAVAGSPIGAERPLGPYTLTRPSLWESYWTGDPSVDQVEVTIGGHVPYTYTPGGGSAGAQGQTTVGRSFRTAFLPWPVEWVNTTAERAEALGPLLEWTSCAIFEDGFELGSSVRWTTSP